ncbi:AraC family transcriptional regulator [Parafilimonas sp.]|uniref:AraC family transcriptional regulator n=1 Tax=Parafilimonas sp. TaxID=1969739 RepID=UPI003F7F5F19
MKPHFHKVPQPLESSFSIRRDSSFGSLWHYHPELELHYLIKGEGVRFIGDNISNFSDGEIVLLGENLPHKWHCRESCNGQYGVEAIVLHFSSNFMGNDMLSLPEARLLPLLFEKAKMGMVITNRSRDRLIPLIEAASKAEGLDRLIALLSILKVLSETKDYCQVTKETSFYQSNKYETERLNLVYSYTMANYSQPITLEQIAAISNLTTTSFCRYFKLMTNKTYYDFLTEIRISHACHFLIEDKMSVDQIADRCGFYNISNFYRQFKKVIGITPLTYKREYLMN